MGLRPYPRQLIGQIVQQLFSSEMALVVFSLKRAKYATSFVESLYTDGSRGEVFDLWSNGFGYLLFDQEAVPAFLKMDGRAVFDFANRDVARSIKKPLKMVQSQHGTGLSLASSGKYPHFG